MNHGQFTKAISKLKADIKKNGYRENLGQKELDLYQDFLFNNSGLPYSQAADFYNRAIVEIDNL